MSKLRQSFGRRQSAPTVRRRRSRRTKAPTETAKTDQARVSSASQRSSRASSSSSMAPRRAAIAAASWPACACRAGSSSRRAEFGLLGFECGDAFRAGLRVRAALSRSACPTSAWRPAWLRRAWQPACRPFVGDGGLLAAAQPVLVAAGIFLPDAVAFGGDGLGHDVVEKGPVVADQEQGAGVVLQAVLRAVPAFRCRGRWSVRRAPARWPAGRTGAPAAGGCARRRRAT